MSTSLEDPLAEVETEFESLREARFDCGTSHTREEFVVDLTNLPTINSDGLSDLLRLHRRVRESGRRLVLANVASHLQRVFVITRLDRLMDIRAR